MFSKLSHRVKYRYAIGFLALAGLVTGCATTESHRAIKPAVVETYRSDYAGKKEIMVVGAFQNQTNFMKGLFFSESDNIEKQAKAILKTHLQQSNHYRIVDRDNMHELALEAEIQQLQQALKGAKYLVSGSITEFGRREIGDQQFFGIFGRGKQQIAFAKVSINIVDVRTTEIVYSTQGAGEYLLKNRQVLGFGGTAKFDNLLRQKVLNFAITEAVNNLVRDQTDGLWAKS